MIDIPLMFVQLLILYEEDVCEGSASAGRRRQMTEIGEIGKRRQQTVASSDYTLNRRYRSCLFVIYDAFKFALVTIVSDGPDLVAG